MSTDVCIMCRHAAPPPEAPDDTLVRRCGCTGETGLAHLSCLRDWAVHLRDSGKAVRCGFCKKRYRVGPLPPRVVPQQGPESDAEDTYMCLGIAAFLALQTALVFWIAIKAYSEGETMF